MNGLNKKADVSFMGGRVANMIIAALVIVILITFIASAVIFFWKNSKSNDLKSANKQLDKILVKIMSVRDSGEDGSVGIFPPSGWYLRTFPDYDFPMIDECRNAVSCLCMCQGSNCGDLEMVGCKGFNFIVKVDGRLRRSASGGAIGYASDPGYVEEAIVFRNSVETLNIIKEGEVIKIKLN